MKVTVSKFRRTHLGQILIAYTDGTKEDIALAEGDDVTLDTLSKLDTVEGQGKVFSCEFVPAVEGDLNSVAKVSDATFA